MSNSLSAFTTDAKFADEAALIAHLATSAALSDTARHDISVQAAELVRRIRAEAKPSLMEHFLGEYGLSSKEGVALMCLAEAMLRVPDAETMDALIEDKIAPSNWGKHLGEASSSLVNASTWALMLTGRVLDDDQPGIAGLLRGAIKRLGEPVIRAAVGRAMKEMGRQFVLGQSIDAALDTAKEEERKGYTYSYDMLGEAAMTYSDAERYGDSYRQAIAEIAKACIHDTVEANPGISIKLSALHPRYEVAQRVRVMDELVPVVLRLALQAKDAGMGLNIDAEEQNRLVLSLHVIEAVLSDERLAGWDGFGVVVQAYGKRAGLVIDWLADLAERLDRRIMVRLVKGAYWDTEMKLAQVEGHLDFPLFTSKVATDVAYIAHARRLFAASDRIYPQFATHNAHTVAAILHMAQGRPFEFQRLHGMGERLHDIVLEDTHGRCRIYAPVGAHRDLLAYLVRRLLENGANSSFVHQIVDEDVSPNVIAADPFASLAKAMPPSSLIKPGRLFAPQRANSTGFDLSDHDTLARIEAARHVPLPNAAPVTLRALPDRATGTGTGTGIERPVYSPSDGAEIARVTEADTATVGRAIEDARPWDATAQERAQTLRRAADLYEQNFGLIFATLAKEAGKTWLDAVGELREAVDFLHYYAAEAEASTPQPRGIIAAISPWNFPLAIFTGQISAALAAGNGVLAKPAEQTPLIATIATKLLLKAGVPASALQLLPGDGATVGAALTRDPRVDGVVFTGSTETAKMIQSAMSETLRPGAPFIAETGGLNAMVVDSTALPEQAVRDIVASAFQSAGQRCSALRCLYVQDDVVDTFLPMIKGAMDALVVFDPWALATDVGPVIDAAAKAEMIGYIAGAKAAGHVLHSVDAPTTGTFVPPTLIEVSGIDALEREIFGPILHVATFGAEDIAQVLDAINATGYGLTFGLHTRIDGRVQEIADQVKAGNIYVNRNQIGAVVGSQPFGGEGLSGTGPKAGGPFYLPRFAKTPGHIACNAPDAPIALPGPTGEANTLHLTPRGPILCLGPSARQTSDQIACVEAFGGQAITDREALSSNADLAGVLFWPPLDFKNDTVHDQEARAIARQLAQRSGPIVSLITGQPDAAHILHERHLCIDTTAAGGNAALLAG